MTNELNTTRQKKSSRSVEDAAAVETMNAVLLVLSADERIRRVNRSFTRVLGLSQREAKGLSVCDTIVPPEDVASFQQGLSQLRAGKNSFEFECRMISRSGKRPLIGWQSTAVLTESSQIEAFVLTGVDVNSERVKGAIAIPATKEMELIPGEYSDRRRERRRTYPYRQLIGMVYNDKLPDREEFVQVSCHTISPGGFSYLTDNTPDYATLIVAFGAPPRLTYIKAEVRHVSTVIQSGIQKFVVGCQFIGRIAY